MGFGIFTVIASLFHIHLFWAAYTNGEAAARDIAGLRCRTALRMLPGDREYERPGTRRAFCKADGSSVADIAVAASAISGYQKLTGRLPQAVG